MIQFSLPATNIKVVSKEVEDDLKSKGLYPIRMEMGHDTFVEGYLIDNDGLIWGLRKTIETDEV